MIRLQLEFLEREREREFLEKETLEIYFWENKTEFFN